MRQSLLISMVARSDFGLPGGHMPGARFLPCSHCGHAETKCLSGRSAPGSCTGRRLRTIEKPFPIFAADKQAEDFVADPAVYLSDYDFRDMVPAREFWTCYEAQPKSSAVQLRLSRVQLAEFQRRAAQAGLPMQRFMRMDVEKR